MHQICVNRLKNRLYITIENLNPAEIPAYITHIEAACKQLIPGFTCLAGFNQKKSLQQADKDFLFSATDLISAYGGLRIVHVGNISETPFQRAGLPRMDAFIPVETASSIKEAEAILNRRPRWDSRSGATPSAYRLRRQGSARPANASLSVAAPTLYPQ